MVWITSLPLVFFEFRDSVSSELNRIEISTKWVIIMEVNIVPEFRTKIAFGILLCGCVVRRAERTQHFLLFRVATERFCIKDVTKRWKKLSRFNRNDEGNLKAQSSEENSKLIFFSLIVFFPFTLAGRSMVRFFFAIFKSWPTSKWDLFFCILFSCEWLAFGQIKCRRWNSIWCYVFYGVFQFRSKLTQSSQHQSQPVAASQYLLSINFAIRWSWFVKMHLLSNFQSVLPCIRLGITTLSVHCMPYSVWVPPTKRAWALWIAFWLTLNTAHTQTHSPSPWSAFKYKI